MTFWFRDFSSSVLLKHSTKPLYNTECTLSLVEMGRFNGGGSGGVGGGGPRIGSATPPLVLMHTEAIIRQQTGHF